MRKGFAAIIVLLLIVTIFAVVVGTYYFTVYKPLVPTKITSDAPTTNLSTVEQQTKASKQKTYIDYGLGFSIDYPSNKFTITEYNGPSYSGFYGIALLPSSGYSIFITVGPATSDKINDDYTSNNPSGIFNQGLFSNGHVLTSNENIQTLTLSSGHKMFRWKGWDSEFGEAEAHYITTSKNSIYEIFINGANLDQSARSEYESIVSTFKIL